MKIVFLVTLAGGAETYLAGDLVEYRDPHEAYRLIKANIARPPTAGEIYKIDAATVRRLAAELEAAADAKARATASRRAWAAERRANRQERHAELKASRRARAEARTKGRAAALEADRAAADAREERRAHYVANIKAAQAAEDAAALEAVAGAVKAYRPRARRHFLTDDERLVIHQLYEQENTTHRALAECFLVSTQTIFKTLHEKR